MSDYIGDKLICPTCGKEFTKEHSAQMYCCKKCRRSYINDFNPFNFLRWRMITIIRSSFCRLMKSNPSKAKELEEKMLEEEGEKFTELVLDGITKTDEFDTLEKIQEKYRKVWEEDMDGSQ